MYQNLLDRFRLKSRLESLPGLLKSNMGLSMDKLKSGLESRLSISRTHIGLDIGTDSIKFVKIQRKGESNHLLSYGIIPVSHLKGRSAEERFTEISEILRTLLKNRDSMPIFEGIFKNRDSMPVFTAVSGSDVVIKSFSIARLSGTKLKNAVFWASKKYVPFPLEEAYFDFKVIGDTEERENKKKEVMVVAVSKQLIHKMLDLFEKTGLKIPGITVTPFALCNLFKVTETGASIALIDIGAENTSIAIFEDNNLRFAREIVTSGNSITESIASQASLSFEDAEKLKIEHGMSKKGAPKECIEGIMPVVERLINEIQRSISFYKERHPDFTLERIYLSGGTARLEGLSQIIQERLSAEVEVIHAFERLDISSPSIDTEEFHKLAPVFTKAVSLALETNESIDLLPSKAKHEKAITRLLPLFKLFGILLILLCIFLYAELAARVHIKTKSLNHLKSNMQKLNDVTLNPGQIQVNSTQYKMIKETLDKLEKRELIDPFILKEMTNIIPEYIVLEGLSISASEESEKERDGSEVGQLQIEGMVCGKEMDLEVELLQFLVTLDTSPFLQRPVLLEKKKAVLAERNILRFKIQCKLES